MSTEAVLQTILHFYLKSDDFNGILLPALCEAVGAAWQDVQDSLCQLVTEEKVTLTFSSVFVNPHIKAFPDLAVQDQIERLGKEDPAGICAYPTSEVIQKAVNLSDHDDRPFTKRLLLGEPQLTPVYFELEILERYHSDPRYRYDFYDYGGSISVTDEHFQSQDFPDRHKVLLQTFGLGYRQDGSRVVVVFLRYLSDLSPQHQQIWNAHIIAAGCRMVREYYQNSILAEWAEHGSVYQAILEEQTAINDMARLMGKPPLFRAEYRDNRPRGFHTLLRPTQRGYAEFILLLDKLLSDNIDKAFFEGDIPLSRARECSDGTVQVIEKGSLVLLDEWLKKHYRLKGDAGYDYIVGPLREVRRLRQKPAHSIETDRYDPGYNAQQDELIGRVYRAVEAIRILLSRHEKAKEYRLPDWLEQGKIKIF